MATVISTVLSPSLSISFVADTMTSCGSAQESTSNVSSFGETVVSSGCALDTRTTTAESGSLSRTTRIESVTPPSETMVEVSDSSTVNPISDKETGRRKGELVSGDRSVTSAAYRPARSPSFSTSRVSTDGAAVPDKDDRSQPCGSSGEYEISAVISVRVPPPALRTATLPGSGGPPAVAPEINNDAGEVDKAGAGMMTTDADPETPRNEADTTPVPACSAVTIPVASTSRRSGVLLNHSASAASSTVPSTSSTSASNLRLAPSTRLAVPGWTVTVPIVTATTLRCSHPYIAKIRSSLRTNSHLLTLPSRSSLRPRDLPTFAVTGIAAGSRLDRRGRRRRKPPAPPSRASPLPLDW